MFVIAFDCTICLTKVSFICVELLADSRTKTEQAESKTKRLQMELDMSEEALNKVTESLILQEEKLKVDILTWQ